MLKTEPQSYSLTKQAYERSDITLLERWLEEMKAQAVSLNDELPFLSYYMDLACIYSGAMSELIRIIQIHSRD